MGKNTPKHAKTRSKPIDTAQVIANAVLKYITDKKGLSFPTQQEIADLTGLGLRTVSRYYKELQFSPMVAPQRALTPLVLNNLFAQTRKSPQAVKLWLQVMEGWSENIKLQTGNEGITIKHQFLDGKPDDVDLSL